MSTLSVKTRRAPSRHCRAARVFVLTTKAMQGNEYTPSSPSFPYGPSSVWVRGRYENGDFSDSPPERQSRKAAFSAIVERFIADGSVDEVNIRYAVVSHVQPGSRLSAVQHTSNQ